MAAWIRRLFCSHRFYIEQITREEDGMVRCACNRCGKVCFATHGLALPGKLEQIHKGVQV